ncbi:MAG: hypothetical protein WCQ95_03120 [Bacteroidota bacterium]
MNFLKKSVAIICLIAFAISTTGISIQKHSCRMEGTTKLALFPEIFGQTTSCCEMPGTTAANNTNSVKNIPCCKNEFTYAKIASLYNNTFLANSITKHLLNIPIVHLLQVSLQEVPQKVIFTDYQPPPLLLYGTSLLHFIHNIKIALPC